MENKYDDNFITFVMKLTDVFQADEIIKTLQGEDEALTAILQQENQENEALEAIKQQLKAVRSKIGINQKVLNEVDARKRVQEDTADTLDRKRKAAEMMNETKPVNDTQPYLLNSWSLKQNASSTSKSKTAP